MHFIEFREVVKKYHMGETTICANNGVSFFIDRGEFAVILGPSGAGKSTTLNILGGIDRIDSGEVWIDGESVGAMNEKQLTQYRRHQVGFVFQNYNLIANLTARENVELAAQLVQDAMSAEEALEAVGLSHRLHNFPSQLSGGEQQRVSIARALAKKPALLLCDEPTGALDYTTGIAILKLLQKSCRETHTTVILVTHNSALQGIADRVIRLSDATVRSNTRNPHPQSIDAIEW